MQREGQRAGIGKGLGRAAQLFIFNGCAFLIVWAVVQSFGAFGIEGPVHKVPDSFAQAALGTILLYDPIPFFNILNFYILMLIALPFFVAAQLAGAGPSFCHARFISHTAVGS